MVNPREREERLWSSVVSRILVNTISHPIEYAKVLIQIGHEPILPRETRTLFGKPALALPNIFQYGNIYILIFFFKYYYYYYYI